MVEIKSGEKTDITLRIKTRVVDPETLDMSEEELLRLFTSLMQELESPNAQSKLLSEKENGEEIELFTEATAEINKEGSVEISYLENEDDPVMLTRCKIIFSENDPGLVVMSKDGAMKAFLSFEEGKTHICTYDTPFMPLKVYVTSEIVDNRLLSHGVLKLKYVLNINDTPPQHFLVDVRIKNN